MTFRIALLPGDGIGPEVIAEARRVLEQYRDARAVPLDFWELPLGAERFLKDGTTFPAELRDEVFRTCRAVLLGAVGDPRVPGFEHARDILMGMRQGWDLYANVRPVRALADRLVPLRERRRRHVSFVIYRENTEGQYRLPGRVEAAGTPEERTIGEELHTRAGVERLLRAAFDEARARRRPLVMTDKSNAIRAQDLWLRVFHELRAEYADVPARHLYFDALAARLVEAPEEFGVIAANNLFGDVLADLGAALAGGLGLMPSANLHASDPSRIGLFEPVHGSAPDLVGRGIANPLGAILSAGMLLEHLGLEGELARMERAASALLDRKLCTPDVGGELSTKAFTREFLAALKDA